MQSNNNPKIETLITELKKRESELTFEQVMFFERFLIHMKNNEYLAAIACLRRIQEEDVYYLIDSFDPDINSESNTIIKSEIVPPIIDELTKLNKNSDAKPDPNDTNKQKCARAIANQRRQRSNIPFIPPLPLHSIRESEETVQNEIPWYRQWF